MAALLVRYITSLSESGTASSSVHSETTVLIREAAIFRPITPEKTLTMSRYIRIIKYQELIR